MKALQAIALLLSALITLPIWFYLLFKMLQLCGASDVMWLLYWVYVPVGFVASAILKIADMDSNK